MKKKWGKGREGGVRRERARKRGKVREMGRKRGE